MINALFGCGIIAGILYGFLIDSAYLKLYLLVLGVYYVVTQVLLIEKDPIFLRRKITISSWGSPSDPTIYLPMDYDTTKTQEYLTKINSSSSDVKITLTHIVTRAVAICLALNKKYVG